MVGRGASGFEFILILSYYSTVLRPIRGTVIVQEEFQLNLKAMDPTCTSSAYHYLLGLNWVYIWIMENKTETTILEFRA